VGDAIGAPKKTSGRSYSPERPVARHFVWLHISMWRAVRKLFKTQVVWMLDSVGIAHSEKELLRLRERM